MKCIFTYISLSLLFLSSNNRSLTSESFQLTLGQQDVSGKWTNLFNGNDLSGWQVMGSEKAKFYVEDGIIIGETQKDIPNSFLATKKEYEDFILELEFKVAKELNSGVQIRSGRYSKETKTPYLSGRLEKSERTWEKGRVYGYQIEIDPSDRAWSGGFYEEGGRGWLFPLQDNDAARNAYKQEEWNKFKIIANDNHFQSWINGVKAIDFYDSKKRSGFIAIQLHSASRDEQIGKKIQIRNLMIKELP